jgi:hypothetical protein
LNQWAHTQKLSQVIYQDWRIPERASHYDCSHLGRILRVWKEKGQEEDPNQQSPYLYPFRGGVHPFPSPSILWVPLAYNMVSGIPNPFKESKLIPSVLRFLKKG